MPELPVVGSDERRRGPSRRCAAIEGSCPARARRPDGLVPRAVPRATSVVMMRSRTGPQLARGRFGGGARGTPRRPAAGLAARVATRRRGARRVRRVPRTVSCESPPHSTAVLSSPSSARLCCARRASPLCPSRRCSDGSGSGRHAHRLAGGESILMSVPPPPPELIETFYFDPPAYESTKPRSQQKPPTGCRPARELVFVPLVIVERRRARRTARTFWRHTTAHPAPATLVTRVRWQLECLLNANRSHTKLWLPCLTMWPSTVAVGLGRDPPLRPCRAAPPGSRCRPIGRHRGADWGVGRPRNGCGGAWW